MVRAAVSCCLLVRGSLLGDRIAQNELMACARAVLVESSHTVLPARAQHCSTARVQHRLGSQFRVALALLHLAQWPYVKVVYKAHQVSVHMTGTATVGKLTEPEARCLLCHLAAHMLDVKASSHHEASCGSRQPHD